MPTVWAGSVSLAATQEVAFALFSCGYLDVSVLHVRPACLCIQHAVIRVSRDQRLFDSFPRLFAAFHALHRLLAPRHPPHALVYLAKMIKCQFTFTITDIRGLPPISALGYVYRCHLDFVRLSKISHSPTLPRQAGFVRRGSVTVFFFTVNPARTKIAFCSD